MKTNQRQKQDKLIIFDEHVLQAILTVVEPHLSLEISARDLGEEMLWEILCHASVNQSSIESSCNALDDAPSGNTVRTHLKAALGDDEQSLALLEDELNSALHAQLSPGLRRKLQSKAWEAAGDWTDIPNHTQNYENDNNIRTNQHKAGTTRFNAYATLAIIRKGKRVTIAMTLMRKGETMDDIVKRLIARARQLEARFKCTYWDKAFGAVEVFRYLRSCHIAYVIALAQRGRFHGIGVLCAGRSSRHTRHTFNQSSEQPYRTDVVIACHYSGCKSKRRPKKKKHGLRYCAYAVYDVGNRSPQAISVAYRRRFSIESGYRQLHRVRARTCSRHMGLRMLLVGLALLLVNLYVLLRATWTHVTWYGSRVCHHRVTLDDVASVLRQEVQRILGFAPKFHCRV